MIPEVVLVVGSSVTMILQIVEVVDP